MNVTASYGIHDNNNNNIPGKHPSRPKINIKFCLSDHGHLLGTL